MEMSETKDSMMHITKSTSIIYYVNCFVCYGIKQAGYLKCTVDQTDVLFMTLNYIRTTYEIKLGVITPYS